MKMPFFSVIIPVRNEAHLLTKCLSSLSAMEYPAENIEIIVADGMSSDDTSDVAKNYGCRVILNEKKTVSPGRNIAFSVSSGEYIAFTDADCIVDSQWLKNSIKYFREDSVACVGGPNHTPSDDSDFAKAVGFVFGQRIFAAGSVHARSLNEVKEVRSIPGCNAIYRKKALDEVMPIDESLLTCDDTELNQRLLDRGYRLLYTPDVFVWHYRRSRPVSLWRQMYRYAIGRVQVGKRDRRMINSVHILIGLGIPLLLSLWLLSSLFLLAFVAASVVFLSFCSLYSLFSTRSLTVSATVPLVIIIIFFAWSAGFVRELLIPVKLTGRN